MSKNNFTTRIRESDDSIESEDSSGTIEEIIGYTLKDTPSRDDRGHYIFSEPKKIDPENKNCYAKEILIKTSSGTIRNKYYVKVGLDGFIFDPWGVFSEGTQGNYAKGQGKSEWSFKQVNYECFQSYSKFLQSRNKAWLTTAEREIR